MLSFIKGLDPFARHNVLEIELEGDIPEEEERFFPPLGVRPRLTVWNLIRVLQHSSENKHITSLFLKLKGLHMGLSKAESLRRSIDEFKAEGKKVYVYLESGGNVEYLLAASADKIYMPPFGILTLIGLSAQVGFYKDLLDKIGVGVNLKAVGRYKSAAETFTRTSMSGPHKEMMEQIFDDLYQRFLSLITSRPGLDIKKAEESIDRGPYTAEAAYKSGLIDGVCYEDQVEDEISKRLDASPSQIISKITFRHYLRALELKEGINGIYQSLRGRSKTIALITDSGVITGGESKTGGAVKTIGAKTILRMLDRVEKDRKIKALVFRVQSPGGSALASDLILNKLKSVTEKMPVVISMSDVAASGGYMISLAADKIVAEHTTLTGSIGVISGKFVLKDLMDKLGIVHEFVKRGRHSLYYSHNTEFTKEEEQNLLDLMQSLYSGFVNRVSEARGLSTEETESVSEGRVWTGVRAKELGLVDEIGGIKEAVKLARELAQIEPDDYLNIKKVQRPRTIRLLPFSPRFSFAIGLDSLFQTTLSLQKEKVLALMPFWIDLD